ncbi:MAG TPA: hypothetical protein VJ935_08300 [Acidimicrobiia bacterium]|nr:hypothetical protein [Acidimicrobiia bacterium]
MVDDYHLEILRGSDLMGRWYLADVEVKREIAERFTLFLGDDEMEFLADDALVFAYEGVTRMQQGWVNAKKRKRRHRRAAADAARRKDEAPHEPEPVTERTEEPIRPPTTTKVPTSDLAKKLAAIASAEAAASESEKRRFTWAEAEALELSESAQTTVDSPPAPKKPRKKTPPKPVAVEPLFTEAPVAEASEQAVFEPVEPARSVEPPAVETPPAAAVDEMSIDDAHPEVVGKKRRRPPKPLIEEPAEPDYPEPSWIAPPPARVVTVDLSVEDPVVTEEPVATEEPIAIEAPLRVEELPKSPEPVEAEDELTRRRQRRKNRRESAAEDQPVEEKEDRKIADLEAARVKVREPKSVGHHPAETNVGLLAKLRRPPKADQEHVHTYQESKSAGGLTRRVCLECNHVSITSDD